MAANAFSNAIDVVIQTVLNGLKALATGEPGSNIRLFTSCSETRSEVLAQALASQATPAAQNIGQNIAIGIANGLILGAPFIQQAAVAAVNAAIQATKAALGIASPSRVFEQQIGMQMSRGDGTRGIQGHAGSAGGRGSGVEWGAYG